MGNTFAYGSILEIPEGENEVLPPQEHMDQWKDVMTSIRETGVLPRFYKSEMFRYRDHSLAAGRVWYVLNHQRLKNHDKHQFRSDVRFRLCKTIPVAPPLNAGPAWGLPTERSVVL